MNLPSVTLKFIEKKQISKVMFNKYHYEVYIFIKR